MRKYEIDNLRNFVILLLFPVHTFMIWNDYGTKFYIWAGEDSILSTLIVIINPWFMPVLFALAGISARYAMEKRSVKEFVVERVKKLGIPFLVGMVCLIPIQTIYARKFFGTASGNLWDQYLYFFTHITDLSGYDGAFTPGHLWFILFLFQISLWTLLITKWIPYEKVKESISKMKIGVILLLFIPVWLSYYVGNFGGFSIGKCFMLYLMGYYVLGNEEVRSKLQKYGKWITAIFIFLVIILAALYYQYSYYGDLLVNFIAWIGILSLLSIFQKYFNKKTRFTIYFNQASFPIYIVHQTILVVLAYYVILNVSNKLISVLVIIAGSFILSNLAYQVIRRIPGIRNLFAMSYKRKS